MCIPDQLSFPDEAEKRRESDEFARRVRLIIHNARQRVEERFRQWGREYDEEVARQAKGAA